jgi:hypothetical protein
MAPVITLTVAPADYGWVLRFPSLDADLFFLSGRRAEAAGRDLAERLAGAGHAVELEVFLRSAATAGRHHYAGSLAA